MLDVACAVGLRMPEEVVIFSFPIIQLLSYCGDLSGEHGALCPKHSGKSSSSPVTPYKISSIENGKIDIFRRPANMLTCWGLHWSASESRVCARWWWSLILGLTKGADSALDIAYWDIFPGLVHRSSSSRVWRSSRHRCLTDDDNHHRNDDGN